MEVNFKEKKEVFEPIEMTIKIETKEELLDLLARSESGAHQVNEGTNYPFANDDSCIVLCMKLISIAKNYV